MKLASRVLLMVLMVGQWAVKPSAAQPDAAKVPLKERIRIASEIYSSINIYFGHWRGVPDLDLEKEFSAYLDQILAGDDRRSFDLASMEFLAKLHNGHSGFRDQWLQDTYGQPFGFYAYPVQGVWVVTRSSVAGLKPGDVITGIDGRKFEDFFQGLRKYVPASNERWARRAFLESPYLFPNPISLSLDDGRKVTVTRQGKFQWPGDEYNEISVSEQDGVAYIRIPSFHDPKLEQAAVQAVERMQNAPAIVVDVRGNHGGSTPVDLTAKLMDRPYRWFAESTPLSIGLFKYRGYLSTHSELYWYGEEQPADKTPYRGMVYILVDGGCFSACEDFVVPFKDNQRATIVGERTAGSSGQPFGKNLGNGMGVGLGTKREFLPDGSEFEGVGIAPDVAVETTVESLRQGNDPVLEKARALVREKLKK